MNRRIFFFAGGEYRDDRNNAFTAHFIRYLTELSGPEFILIRDVYHRWPLANVVYALNRAQVVVARPESDRMIRKAMDQIGETGSDPNVRLVILASSYGSVLAAQVACRLAERRKREGIPAEPIDIGLGASMVSKESPLYRRLLTYRDEGYIDRIVYDELQDEGDNAVGIGGRTRMEGYRNALGICFPFLTRRYSGPSFLDTDPVSGHIHRRRSQSIGKARDFIRVLLVEYRLGGEEAGRRAAEIAGEA